MEIDTYHTISGKMIASELYLSAMHNGRLIESRT